MKTFYPHHPYIVATVTQRADLEYLRSNPTELKTDLLEFRIDNLPDSLDEIKETVAALPDDIGILTTVRDPSEGGGTSFSPEERAGLYKQLFPQSDFLDTEVASFDHPEIADIVAEAKSRKILVVASFHDFEKCPSQNKLTETINKACELGADIAKVAVAVNTFTELAVLIDIVETSTSQGKVISAMGMGKLGKLSRLVLARAGSCLNYGYLQKANAPGQWSASKLKELIGEI